MKQAIISICLLGLLLFSSPSLSAQEPEKPSGGCCYKEWVAALRLYDAHCDAFRQCGERDAARFAPLTQYVQKIRQLIKQETTSVLASQEGTRECMPSADQLHDICARVGFGLINKVWPVGVVETYRDGKLIPRTTNQVGGVYEIDGCPEKMKDILLAGMRCNHAPTYFSEGNYGQLVFEEIPDTGIVAISFFMPCKVVPKAATETGVWWRVVFLPISAGCLEKTADELRKEYIEQRPKCS
jgi:hypothetical protein